jgi:hypothetical protein
VLSVLGIAREVAAIMARKLTPPALEPVTAVTREDFRSASKRRRNARALPAA